MDFFLYIFFSPHFSIHPPSSSIPFWRYVADAIFYAKTAPSRDFIFCPGPPTPLSLCRRSGRHAFSFGGFCLADHRRYRRGRREGHEKKVLCPRFDAAGRRGAGREELARPGVGKSGQSFRRAWLQLPLNSLLLLLLLRADTRDYFRIRRLILADVPVIEGSGRWSRYPGYLSLFAIDYRESPLGFRNARSGCCSTARINSGSIRVRLCSSASLSRTRTNGPASAVNGGFQSRDAPNTTTTTAAAHSLRPQPPNRMTHG